MSETFIPVIDSRGPDVGMDVNVSLKKAYSSLKLPLLTKSPIPY
jgi:hypothetical protein